eukprot:m.118660 g.118660  ORF g.118660 m.118660 type:complete len:55 (+) comp19517_c0_seq1:871-1035(+)
MLLEEAAAAAAAAGEEQHQLQEEWYRLRYLKHCHDHEWGWLQWLRCTWLKQHTQ